MFGYVLYRVSEETGTDGNGWRVAWRAGAWWCDVM
jgi:hypothetical protein